jgi:hypothetical protein
LERIARSVKHERIRGRIGQGQPDDSACDSEGKQTQHEDDGIHGEHLNHIEWDDTEWVEIEST